MGTGAGAARNPYREQEGLETLVGTGAGAAEKPGTGAAGNTGSGSG